jgi:hypothetical protein
MWLVVVIGVSLAGEGSYSEGRNASPEKGAGGRDKEEASHKFSTVIHVNLLGLLGVNHVFP